jgi:hypothetical protein
MAEKERSIRGRLPRDLLIDHDGRQTTIAEDRRPAWNKLLIYGTLCALVSGALIMLQPNMVDAVAIICGLLFGIPFAIAALFVCPWNRRVIVDGFSGVCTRQKRYYTLPYWTRDFMLLDGQIELVPVVHLRYDTVPKNNRSGASGCLTLFLGPIGAIFDGIALANSVKRLEQKAWALVFRETRLDQEKSHILICCRNKITLRDAAAEHLNLNG